MVPNCSLYIKDDDMLMIAVLMLNVMSIELVDSNPIRFRMCRVCVLQVAAGYQELRSNTMKYK
ncbi:hypothetical protein BLOT_002451 [Blomia tropicalis]|nr:hypothetical protein BLOT_002451 [Blomia tropicalis]